MYENKKKTSKNNKKIEIKETMTKFKTNKN
jgi:hypothetical protein